MRVHLIRHAQAGDRHPGSRDRYRQLSAEGHERARQIAVLLGREPVVRVVSSPATRCVQTVGPLATALGIEVEELADLWEGSPIVGVLDLLAGHDGGDLVACSHGDIIPAVIETLGDTGVPVTGRGCEKGSIWVLDRVGDQWVRAAYVNRSRTELPEPA